MILHFQKNLSGNLSLGLLPLLLKLLRRVLYLCQPHIVDCPELFHPVLIVKEGRAQTVDWVTSRGLFHRVATSLTRMGQNERVGKFSVSDPSDHLKMQHNIAC